MNLVAEGKSQIEKTIKIPIASPRQPEDDPDVGNDRVVWQGDWLAQAAFQNEVMGFITSDQVPGRIALLTSPKLTDDRTERDIRDFITPFEYACVDDLLDTWVRLKDEGIEPHMCLDHGFVISYYWKSDGNSVELQADWNNSATSCAFMETSPVFASNPIGRFVDPAKMVELRKSGTSIAELHRRAYEAEFEPEVRPDLRMAT